MLKFISIINNYALLVIYSSKFSAILTYKILTISIIIIIINASLV